VVRRTKHSHYSNTTFIFLRGQSCISEVGSRGAVNVSCNAYYILSPPYWHSRCSTVVTADKRRVSGVVLDSSLTFDHSGGHLSWKLGGPGHVSLPSHFVLPLLFLSFSPGAAPLFLIQHCKLSSGSRQSQAVEHILMHFTFKKPSKVYTLWTCTTHIGMWVKVKSSDFRRQREEG